MAKVTLVPRAKFNKTVAYQAKPAVREAAEEIGTKAEGILASHRKSGDAHVEVTHGKLDSEVELVASETGKGMAVASIEFGNKDQEALYVLHRAAGLV